MVIEEDKNYSNVWNKDCTENLSNLSDFEVFEDYGPTIIVNKYYDPNIIIIYALETEKFGPRIKRC